MWSLTIQLIYISQLIYIVRKRKAEHCKFSHLCNWNSKYGGSGQKVHGPPWSQGAKQNLYTKISWRSSAQCWLRLSTNGSCTAFVYLITIITVVQCRYHLTQALLWRPIKKIFYKIKSKTSMRYCIMNYIEILSGARQLINCN